MVGLFQFGISMRSSKKQSDLKSQIGTKCRLIVQKVFYLEVSKYEVYYKDHRILEIRLEKILIIKFNHNITILP